MMRVLRDADVNLHDSQSMLEGACPKLLAMQEHLRRRLLRLGSF